MSESAFSGRVPIEEIAGSDRPEELAQLRSRRPVCPVRHHDGSDAWLVTGYSEVKQVLTDPRFRRNPDITGNKVAVRPSEGHRSTPMRSLESDGEPHQQLRRLVSPWFSGRATAAYEHRILELATGYIEAMAAAGPPADLLEVFARPFPISVIRMILGITVDDADAAHLRTVIEAAMSLGDRSEEEITNSRIELFTYFQGILAAKRTRPGDDLLTKLIAEADAGRLSDMELSRLAITVFVAGHETTVNAIALGTWRLLQCPDQLAKLYEHPHLIPSAVEELLRLQFHPTVGIDRRRYVGEQVTLGGETLSPGDVVIASINAANQEGAVFAEPTRLDVTRQPNPHMSFGDGPHFCLGAALARCELVVALRALLARFPGLRLDEEVQPVRRRRGLLVAGVESLPLTW